MLSSKSSARATPSGVAESAIRVSRISIAGRERWEICGIMSRNGCPAHDRQVPVCVNGDFGEKVRFQHINPDAGERQEGDFTAKGAKLKREGRQMGGRIPTQRPLTSSPFNARPPSYGPTQHPPNLTVEFNLPPFACFAVNPAPSSCPSFLRILRQIKSLLSTSPLKSRNAPRSISDAAGRARLSCRGGSF